MPSNILMPKGGQTTDESVLLNWKKNVGDKIQRGDVLFEIETDKAVMEVESFAGGILLEQRYKEGDTVEAGEVVAVIGEASETKVSEPVKASPAARHLAKEEGIDLAKIAASIKDRPVKKADIPIKVKSTEKPAAVSNSYFVTAKADMSQIMRIMEELDKHPGNSASKINMIDLMKKCVAKAIEKYPLLGSVTDIRIIDIMISGITCVIPSLLEKEACVLTLGGIRKSTVVIGKDVEIRPVMEIAGSFDRNLTDEGYGASFLDEIRRLAEDPFLFLI